MELKQIQATLTSVIKKYKYVILIVLIGLSLMLMPSGKADTSPVIKQSVTEDDDKLQQELTDILSFVQGAGNVKVMVNKRTGQHTVYQTDESISSSDDATDSKTDTIILTDADRNQQGLIKQVNPATYHGVLVLCQGADDPQVKLSIIEAVSKLTGLGADRIAVLKMK